MLYKKWVYIKSFIMKHIFKILFLLIIPVLFFFKNILSYVNTHMKMQTKPLKIVVFDLDETLGYFTEISIFWDALEHFYESNLLPDKFFEMMDVFPEVFRPDMLHILDFLRKKKSKKACYKIFIYTNNQGPKSWVTMIGDYISAKVGSKVFDFIVAAYKVRGKQIEPNRTSHEKSVIDLIKCTNIPDNVEICFIDDLYHPLMDKDNVYYINIKPYRVSMPFEEMASRYYDAVLSKTSITTKAESISNKADFVKKIVAFMNQYNYMVLKKSEEEANVDKIVSKQLLANLDDFLKINKAPNTRKRRNRRVKSIRNYKH